VLLFLSGQSRESVLQQLRDHHRKRSNGPKVSDQPFQATVPISSHRDHTAAARIVHLLLLLFSHTRTRSNITRKSTKMIIPEENHKGSEDSGEDSDCNYEDSEDENDKDFQEYARNLADLDLPEDLLIQKKTHESVSHKLLHAIRCANDDFVAVVSEVVDHKPRKARALKCQCLRKQINGTVRFEDIVQAVVDARNYMRSFDETFVQDAFKSLVSGLIQPCTSIVLRYSSDTILRTYRMQS
jgi:hypothetical protein